MKLYHGTISTCAENIIKNGILIKKGKASVDFGKGFYTTPDIRFAISTAKNKTDKTNYYYNYKFCEPIILTYEYTEIEKLNIYKFKERDLNWAQFIINNRNGLEYVKNINHNFHNINACYDIVSGEIADNKITTLANELKIKNEKLAIHDFEDILYQYNARQYSFHTEKSLCCISLNRCVTIEEMKGDVSNEQN